MPTEFHFSTWFILQVFQCWTFYAFFFVLVSYNLPTATLLSAEAIDTFLFASHHKLQLHLDIMVYPSLFSRKRIYLRPSLKLKCYKVILRHSVFRVSIYKIRISCTHTQCTSSSSLLWSALYRVVESYNAQTKNLIWTQSQCIIYEQYTVRVSAILLLLWRIILLPAVPHKFYIAVAI